MNLQEAQDILRDARISYSYEVPADEPPRIKFEGTNDEIIFTDDGAYYKYRTHDNCSECGSPINWQTKAEEVTKEDLKEVLKDE